MYEETLQKEGGRWKPSGALHVWSQKKAEEKAYFIMSVGGRKDSAKGSDIQLFVRELRPRQGHSKGSSALHQLSTSRKIL